MFFDEEGRIRLDELVAEDATFKKIMEDREVTDQELADQSERVVGLFRNLERDFTPEQQARVAELLTQTGILYAVSRYKELQEFHR